MKDPLGIHLFCGFAHEEYFDEAISDTAQVTLPNGSLPTWGKIFKSSGHCLKPQPGVYFPLCCSQNACNQDAAVCAWTGRVCSGCSEQLSFTPDYTIWSMNYFFSGWKEAGNLERQFSCQPVIFKMWVGIKISHRQVTSVTTLGCKMVLLAHWSSLQWIQLSSKKINT